MLLHSWVVQAKVDRVVLYISGHHINLSALGDASHVYIILALTMNIAILLGTTLETDFIGRCGPVSLADLGHK